MSLKIIHADENVHRWQILQKTAFQAKHQMCPGRFVKHLDMDNCKVKTFVVDVNLFILHIKYWNIRIVYRRHGK